ncbi:hypothetical protein [Pseudomonas sp. B392_1p]|uniref:hypothetical protein n=1 Tax=Pseudomonas sp. B392_1p TaxID=3457507 RepID=UPI003FCF6656
MPTEKSQKVRAFLKEHVYNLSVSGSSGHIVDLPEYEIHPREFLEFAEAELKDLSSNQSIVNCISNLKRAIDCQIDIFLFSLNLLSIYKKRKLGIDKKLGFIERCGMFSKYSLSRINTIRNRLEHDYQIPKIDDIYIYFDIVTAFISVLEVQLLIGGNDGELEFKIVEYPANEEDEPIKLGYLSSRYEPSKKSHYFKWKKGDLTAEHYASSDILEELAAFIRYHTLLLNINRTYHGQYANSQLDKL